MDRAFGFDKAATEACKGTALLLLLWHHLFYAHPEYGLLTFQTAQLAKVCVAIFVLLSGYGLSKSADVSKQGLLAFYVGRFAKLYLNYWLIAAIFIPIGVLLMSRPLSGAYNGHAGIKFLLQMLGLHRYLYSEYGYNGTWWYISTILGLYALFPFVLCLLRRSIWWGLPFCVLVVIPGAQSQIPVLGFWLFPFVLGIFLARTDGFVHARRWLARFRSFRYVLVVSAVASCGFFRQLDWAFGGMRIDWLLGALIILLTYELVASTRTPAVLHSLSFIGRHSFNIFLFHTFVYSYYWRDIVYSFKYPPIILAFLLVSCLLISMGIEALKRVIGYYPALAAIRRLPLHGS